MRITTKKIAILVGLFSLSLLASVPSSAVAFSDDFEDGIIDGNLWLTGGKKTGVGGVGSGDWTYSANEVTASDSYLELRVEGPPSANTYGAESWARTTYDFNDGRDYLIDFTWEADVTIGNHFDHYFIEVTDGYVNITDTLTWNIPGQEDPPGLTNLFYEALTSGPGLPMSSWSVIISNNAVARLYDGPNGTGTLLTEGQLDPTREWYLRFMVTDATSAGFI